MVEMLKNIDFVITVVSYIRLEIRNGNSSYGRLAQTLNRQNSGM